MDRKEIAQVLASAGGGGAPPGEGGDFFGRMRPKHQFGQNFMVDGNLLRAIADAGDIGPRDVVLEVGPGVGNLTRELSVRAAGGAVLAVDIDRQLLPAAQRHHAALGNVTWLLADVLAGKHEIEPRVIAALRDLLARQRAAAGADEAAWPEGVGLKLVSNLPYNAASPLIAELLVAMWRDVQATEARAAAGGGAAGGGAAAAQGEPLLFSRMAFTVQWEVAQRMAAAADTRDYGPLGILLQAMARVEIVRKIPPGAFWPRPKIHSALVVVVPDIGRMAALADVPGFQRLLAGIFGHRRQTLGNALRHYLRASWRPSHKTALGAEGFDLSLRPENLAIAELIRLSEVVGRMKSE